MLSNASVRSTGALKVVSAGVSGGGDSIVTMTGSTHGAGGSHSTQTGM